MSIPLFNSSEGLITAKDGYYAFKYNNRSHSVHDGFDVTYHCHLHEAIAKFHRLLVKSPVVAMVYCDPYGWVRVKWEIGYVCSLYGIAHDIDPDHLLCKSMLEGRWLVISDLFGGVYGYSILTPEEAWSGADLRLEPSVTPSDEKLEDSPDNVQETL